MKYNLKYKNPLNTPIIKRAEGGSLQQKSSEGSVSKREQDNLISFAMLYLKNKGVAETDMLNAEGTDFSDTYKDEVAEVIAIVAEQPEEFWSDFEKEPEYTVQQFIKVTDPENVVKAQKGAYLQKLKKVKKRCKCGCELVKKKEGGKLVDKCSCGCKSDKK